MTNQELAELVEAHQAEIFRYLRFIGADYAVAEDVLQEAFIRAFKAPAAPDLGNERVRRAWLRKIAHNQFIDHCRRNQRSPLRFTGDSIKTIDAYWTDEFTSHDDGFGCLEALEACLQQLSERQRSMIDAFYHARRSREDIAASLGISPDGVKMALRRIRQALGKCIEQRLAEA